MSENLLRTQYHSFNLHEIKQELNSSDLPFVKIDAKNGYKFWLTAKYTFVQNQQENYGTF
ncbi:hypothetical protein [Nostoc punctiforme]|uniref:hypothetical protein n=1 Tax=Nostoc punctiforme TaxID=272131 RepID=UPI0003028DCF|nr:hypothetical protein [Nostoc punctiforme]